MITNVFFLESFFFSFSPLTIHADTGNLALRLISFQPMMPGGLKFQFTKINRNSTLNETKCEHKSIRALIRHARSLLNMTANKSLSRSLLYASSLTIPTFLFLDHHLFQVYDIGIDEFQLKILCNVHLHVCHSAVR